MATLKHEDTYVEGYMADKFIGQATLVGHTWFVAIVGEKEEVPFKDGFLANRYLAAYPDTDRVFRTDEAVFYEEKHLRRFWK